MSILLVNNGAGRGNRNNHFFGFLNYLSLCFQLLLTFGAAVIQMEIPGPVMGVIRMTQASEDKCVIDGTIDGLTPGKHGLNIHEFGDLSDACTRYRLFQCSL